MIVPLQHCLSATRSNPGLVLPIACYLCCGQAHSSVPPSSYACNTHSLPLVSPLCSCSQWPDHGTAGAAVQPARLWPPHTSHCRHLRKALQPQHPLPRHTRRPRSQPCRQCCDEPRCLHLPANQARHAHQLRSSRCQGCQAQPLSSISTQLVAPSLNTAVQTVSRCIPRPKPKLL